MPLAVQSRRVGDITVIQCGGRIVEGTESTVLNKHLSDLLVLPRRPNVVLDLTGVNFIDSSGLGLLVRLLAKTRAAHGNLTLCAAPANVGEVLRVTKLNTILHSYASESDAIAAFYEQARSAGASYRFNADVLCVASSANVLAYVRELLTQAGYGVVTAEHLPDALTLMHAVRPKAIIIDAALHAARGTHTADTFNRLADALDVIELPALFSSDDPSDAGRQLLEQIRGIKGLTISRES